MRNIVAASKHWPFAFALMLCLLMLAVVSACSQEPGPQGHSPDTPVFSDVSDIPAEPASLTFFAAGDILAHDLLAAQGRQADGSYNYDFIFSHMRNEIASYDVSAITQETPFVDDPSQVSGYPTFGTPCEMADAIVDSGIDVVIGATNHSFDKGVYGLETTMSYWKQHHPETTILGLHDKPKDADSVSFMESKGIRIAMVEFSYGLNGFELPAGREYMVDLQSELDSICANLEAAEDKCDLTIAFAHMGVEYSTTPSEEQRQVAARLADAGADVVIMSHVHVVQPCEEISTAAGNSAIVYYGLGNFVSNQVEVENMLGGAAILEIEKKPSTTGFETHVASHQFVPLFCHWDSATSQMYFLDDYTDELAATHAIARSKPFSIAQIRQIWTSIVEQG